MYLRGKKSREIKSLPSENPDSKSGNPILDINIQVRKVNDKMIFSLETEQCQVMGFFLNMFKDCLKDNFRFVCVEEEATNTDTQKEKVKKISAYSIDRKSSLTEREVEVLEKISLGWSNQKIADHFNSALATIKTHVQSIIQKLGVSGRYRAGLEYRKLFGN